MITDDLNIFLADFGVTVTSGAVSGMGILDMPGEVIVNNTILSTDYSVTVRTADFGNLLYGAPVTVAGVSYAVRDCLPVADGAFSVLVLSKLAGGATAPGSQPREFGLQDLADVNVTGAEDGDVLVRENGVWVDGQDDNGIAISVALE